MVLNIMLHYFSGNSGNLRKAVKENETAHREVHYTVGHKDKKYSKVINIAQKDSERDEHGVNPLLGFKNKFSFVNRGVYLRRFNTHLYTCSPIQYKNDPDKFVPIQCAAIQRQIDAIPLNFHFYS